MLPELFQAIRQGDADKVKQILQAHPALVNAKDPRGFSPLVMATYLGSSAGVEALIQAGADVNLKDAAGNTALMGVSFKGNLEMARLLIDHGAELHQRNKNGATALTFAVQYGQVDAVKLLLHALSNTSSNIAEEELNALIQLAKSKNNQAVIDVLMDTKASQR